MSASYSEFKINQFKFTYDTNKYNFVEKLNKIFDNWDNSIENIHNFYEGSINDAQVTIFKQFI